jgi:hypothetical protein
MTDHITAHNKAVAIENHILSLITEMTSDPARVVSIKHRKLGVFTTSHFNFVTPPKYDLTLEIASGGKSLFMVIGENYFDDITYTDMVNPKNSFSLTPLTTRMITVHIPKEYRCSHLMACKVVSDRIEQFGRIALNELTGNLNLDHKNVVLTHEEEFLSNLLDRGV